jgi:methionyl-tRNA formyltransferase
MTSSHGSSTPPGNQQRPSLRVGIMIDGPEQPAWVGDVVRQLASSEAVVLAVVVVNGAAERQSESPGLVARARRWVRNRAALPYALYQRLDNARYTPAIDPEAPVDLGPLIADVGTTLVATPRMTRHCDYIDAPTIASLRALDLDVMVRFGFRILKGEILDCARHGVWSFHHGDNTVKRGGPPGYWEVAEGSPTTGAVLQRLSDQLDGGHVLARSFAATHTISVRRNRANSAALAKQLLLPALARLRDEGPDAMGLAATSPGAWDAYAERLYVAPRPWQVATLVGRIAGRLLKNKLRQWYSREQWLLAIRFNRAAPPDNEVPDGTPHRFTELVPPRDRFWADPFPVLHEGRYFVFYEQLVYSHGVGEIWVMELDEQGAPHSHRPALRQPYHLSYPNVFRWRDEWYMVPETFDKRRIEVYRATRFPDAWAPAGVALEGVDAVDPTITEVDGVWWLMFATVVPGTEEASTLHLYHASSPLGPWTAHRRNPVKVDVRGARPAGRVFRHGKRFYRPAQDGAPRYGEAIRVFEIVTLTESVYEEREVGRLAPRWRPGLVGTHTINAAGALTAIDARQRTLRWR